MRICAGGASLALALTNATFSPRSQIPQRCPEPTALRGAAIFRSTGKCRVELKRGTEMTGSLFGKMPMVFEKRHSPVLGSAAAPAAEIIGEAHDRIVAGDVRQNREYVTVVGPDIRK